MKLQKLSKDFTPAHEELLFAINTQTDEPQDVVVEVVDLVADEVLATQRLREIREAQVNISPYIKPFTEHLPTRFTHTMFDDAPTAKCTIRFGEESADALTVSVNRAPVEQPSLVSTMPFSRTIAHGESDELLIFAEPGSLLEANIVADTGESCSIEYVSIMGATKLYISTKDFGKKVRSLEVELSCNGVEFSALHYRVVPSHKGSVRMAWISDCGSIERYTFPVVVKSQRKAERESIDTVEGRRVVRSVAESILSVRSFYEPRATIEAIAQMLSSTRVWIEYPKLYREVEVLDSVLDVNIFGEPECVMFGVQEWHREERAL